MRELVGKTVTFTYIPLVPNCSNDIRVHMDDKHEVYRKYDDQKFNPSNLKSKRRHDDNYCRYRMNAKIRMLTECGCNPFDCVRETFEHMVNYSIFGRNIQFCTILFYRVMLL